MKRHEMGLKWNGTVWKWNDGLEQQQLNVYNFRMEWNWDRTQPGLETMFCRHGEGERCVLGRQGGVNNDPTTVVKLDLINTVLLTYW